MKFITLPKPHGYLVWKDKQKAIVSAEPLPAGEKALLVQDDKEAFGEIVLSQPSLINLKEFERLEIEHSTRPEERRLRWPDNDVFYLYHIKDWKPFSDSIEVNVKGEEAELIDAAPLTDEELVYLEQVERLPKVLTLSDDVVVIEDGETKLVNGIDGQKVLPVIEATLQDVDSPEGILSVYDLALVRRPRLILKKNMQEGIMEDDVKAEGTKPYTVMEGMDGCEGYAVVKEGTTKVLGCHETSGQAADQIKVLMAVTKEEEKKPGKKNYGGSLEQQAQRVRSSFGTQFDPNMKSDMIEEGPRRAWVKEVYDDYVVVDYNGKLYSVDYEEEEDKCVFADKSKWVELKQVIVPTGMVGAKSYEEALKEYSFGQWIDLYYEFAGKAATDLTEEEAIKAVWTGAFVNTLPDSSFLYIVPNCGERDSEGKTKPRSCRMFPYKDAAGKVDLPHLRNAIARAPQASSIPENIRTRVQKRAQDILARENEGNKEQRSLLTKAMESIKEFLDFAPKEEDEAFLPFLEGESGIGVKKVGDDWWYITFSTNAFEDREKEIFSTKSLEDYVSIAEKQDSKGYFNLWHIKSKERPDLTDFAEKKWQGVIGRFLVEAGPFLKDDKGRAALEFFKQYSDGHPELAPEGWGCSPEYKYLPEERKTGVYKNIHITRTSTLPRMAAANVWTLGGMTMALTKEQEKTAKAIFGEELTKQIMQLAEDKTKELEEAGVAHKEAPTEEEEVQEEEQPVTETTEEEKPVTEEETPQEVTLDAVVAELTKAFQIEWEPVQKLIEEQGAQIQSLTITTHC